MRIGKQKNPSMYKCDKCGKYIHYDRNMNLIKEWESASIAGEKLGIWQQGIVACLKRRTKTAGNYIWRYKEGEDGKNSNRKETNTND